jgi:hypothetical protein
VSGWLHKPVFIRHCAPEAAVREARPRHPYGLPHHRLSRMPVAARQVAIDGLPVIPAGAGTTGTEVLPLP